MRKWMSAGCLLVVMCACSSVPSAVAQTSGSGNRAADTKTAKKRGKTAGADSKASTSGSVKAHPASHPSASKHQKSSGAVAAHSSKSSSRKTGKRKATARGQQKIDSERAQQIQEALIREHYLSGEAAGSWNQASEDAMRRYQADHGWQSKTVPDSRALISLGLGPSHDHLLNPESAMTTEPAAPRAASLTPASHSADPGARLSTTPAANSEPVPASTPAHDAPNLQ